MARPLWFRLFGRNSEYTSEQYLQAVRDSDSGDHLALTRFFGLFASVPVRPDPGSNLSDTPRVTLTTTRLTPVSQTDLQDRLDAVATAAATIVPKADVEAELDTPTQPDAPSDADAPSEALPDAPAASESTGGITPGPDSLLVGDAERTASVQFGTMPVLQFSGTVASPFGGTPTIANYVVAYSDDFQMGLVYDAATKTLLTGGPGDWPELGAGADDTLELNGDFSAGYTLPGAAGLDTIVVREGADYNVITSDDDVAAYETLTVNAMPLGADNHIIFDGSAERDGNFVFFGGDANDIFLGGGGNDRIAGLGGADVLSGGGGSDIFVYTAAGESSGTAYDTLADFDPAADRIDLPGGVASFGDAIEGGTLSLDSFNDDLSAVLAGLEPAQAVWFAPDTGDLAGQIFLIVDGNGQAGYQEGEDFVFAVAGSPLADLTGHPDIFI